MLDQGDWSRCLALFTSHRDIVGSEEGETGGRKREGEREEWKKKRERERGGGEEGETRRNAVQGHITPIKIAAACN